MAGGSNDYHCLPRYREPSTEAHRQPELKTLGILDNHTIALLANSFDYLNFGIRSGNHISVHLSYRVKYFRLSWVVQLSVSVALRVPSPGFRHPCAFEEISVTIILGSVEIWRKLGIAREPLWDASMCCPDHLC